MRVHQPRVKEGTLDVAVAGRRFLCLTSKGPGDKASPNAGDAFVDFMSGSAWVTAFPSQTDSPSLLQDKALLPCPTGRARCPQGWGIGGPGGAGFPGRHLQRSCPGAETRSALRPAEAFTLRAEGGVQWYRMSLTSASDLPSAIRAHPSLLVLPPSHFGCASAGGPRRSVLYSPATLPCNEPFSFLRVPPGAGKVAFARMDEQITGKCSFAGEKARRVRKDSAGSQAWKSPGRCNWTFLRGNEIWVPDYLRWVMNVLM